MNAFKYIIPLLILINITSASQLIGFEIEFLNGMYSIKNSDNSLGCLNYKMVAFNKHGWSFSTDGHQKLSLTFPQSINAKHANLYAARRRIETFGLELKPSAPISQSRIAIRRAFRNLGTVYQYMEDNKANHIVMTDQPTVCDARLPEPDPNVLTYPYTPTIGTWAVEIDNVIRPSRAAPQITIGIKTSAVLLYDSKLHASLDPVKSLNLKLTTVLTEEAITLLSANAMTKKVIKGSLLLQIYHMSKVLVNIRNHATISKVGFNPLPKWDWCDFVKKTIDITAVDAAAYLNLIKLSLPLLVDYDSPTLNRFLDDLLIDDYCRRLTPGDTSVLPVIETDGNIIVVLEYRTPEGKCVDALKMDNLKIRNTNGIISLTPASINLVDACFSELQVDKE